MKKFRKLLTALTVSLMALALTVPAFAAEPDEYTYTARLYAGGQGTVSTAAVAAIVTSHGEKADATVSMQGDVVVIDGLHAGDRIAFTRSGVALLNNSKYYVRGFRKSGRDNTSSTLAGVTVAGDCDYVVSYALLGSSVEYTVRYLDEEGKELLPMETFYGNVGDEAVVAFQYVDGYYPVSDTITGTLSENAAENVFTFVYTTRNPADGGDDNGDGGNGGNGGTNNGNGGTNGSGNGTNNGTGDGTNGNGTNNGTGDGTNGNGTNGNDSDGTNGGTVNMDGDQNATVNPDNENLDDSNNPAASNGGSNNGTNGANDIDDLDGDAVPTSPFKPVTDNIIKAGKTLNKVAGIIKDMPPAAVAGVGAGIVLVIGLIVFLIVFLNKKKRSERG